MTSCAQVLAITLVGTLSVGASHAQSIVPVHTIRAGDVVTAEDIRIGGSLPGLADIDVDAAIGLEARRALYAGRPIRMSDLTAPALVERNQIVTIVYKTAVLSIETEGRALDRGAAGDTLRVINLASRTTVVGRVNRSGAVLVGQ